MSREARLAEYEETAELVVVVGSGRSSLARGPAADLVTRLAGRAGRGGALGVVIIRSAVALSSTHHITDDRPCVVQPWNNRKEVPR